MVKKVTKDIFDCVPEINFESGYRYFIGNIDNYIKAMLSVLKSVKSKLPILMNMVYSEEYEGLRLITQTFQRMMKNIGAMELSDLSYDLETEVLNQNYDMVKNDLVMYIQRLSSLTDHLEIFFKNIDFRYDYKQKENVTSLLHYDFTKTVESIRQTSNLLERKIL